MIQSEERLLRLPEVLKYVPVSRAQWYLGLARGDYPASVKIGPRAVAWRLSDIAALVENGIEA